MYSGIIAGSVHYCSDSSALQEVLTLSTDAVSGLHESPELDLTCSRPYQRIINHQYKSIVSLSARLVISPWPQTAPKVRFDHSEQAGASCTSPTRPPCLETQVSRPCFRSLQTLRER